MNDRQTAGRGPLAVVIIPAHDEEAVIGRLLSALQPNEAGGASSLEVIVVCNGCTDRTAEVARRAYRGSTVVEIEEPSKRAALRVGDGLATAFPRVYVDADVEVDHASVLALAEAVTIGGYLAAAPERTLPRESVSWVVNRYFDVWERLPQVRTGLFGRGVIALSQAGHLRVSTLPAALSDDLVMSEAFAEEERIVISSARVVVRPPRRVSDLLRRRIRVATGNLQADGQGTRSDAARTTLGSLFAVVVREPALLVSLPVFLIVTVASRVAAGRAARRGDFTTWLRDDSSRTVAS